MSALEALWATDLGDHLVAAVTNAWQWNHAWRPAALGIEPTEYFNGGVLLMNLALMRREGSSAALLRYGHEHAARLPFRDQDALNAVLGPRRLALHPRWNCMNGILTLPSGLAAFGKREVEEARREPGIRHFEGPLYNKPWDPQANPQLREIYEHHRRHTPWPPGPAPARPRRRPHSYPGAALSSESQRPRLLPSKLRAGANARGRALWGRTGSRVVARLSLQDLINRTGNFGSTRWLGTPIWQNVLDLWTIQEAIAEIRPKLLIEVGTHKGGSALFYANLMDLLGKAVFSLWTSWRSTSSTTPASSSSLEAPSSLRPWPRSRQRQRRQTARRWSSSTEITTATMSPPSWSSTRGSSHPGACS